MNSKKKAILDRIEQLEGDIVKAKEYLETGKHADWHEFRPLFIDKVKDGKILPPHEDWVRNVFLPIWFLPAASEEPSAPNTYRYFILSVLRET